MTTRRPVPAALPDSEGPLPLTDAQRSAVVRLAATWMTAAALLAAIGLALFVPEQIARQISTVVILCASAGAIYILNERSAALANAALLWLFWAAIMLTALLNGGLDAPLVYGLPGLAAMSQIMTGRTNTIALAVASIAGAIALALAQSMHMLPPAPPPPPLWKATVISLILLVYGGVAARLARAAREHHAQTGNLARAASRLLAQSALREQESAEQRMQHQHLIAAQALAGIGMFVIENQRFTEANEAFCRISGYTLQELQALPCYLDLIHDSERERVGGYQTARLRGESVTPRYDTSIVTFRGEKRDIEVAVTIDHHTGRPRVFGTVIDITARKDVERALQQSQEMLSHAFSSSPLSISITRLEDGRVLDVNPAYADMIEWPRETLIGRKLIEFGVWPNVDERQRWSAALLQNRQLKDYPVSSRTRTGLALQLAVNAEIIDIGGEVCVLAFVTDLTELRRAEADLKQSEERFGRIFHSSPVATVVTRLADSAYLDVNPAFTRLFGWTREEALQATAISLRVWESAEVRAEWVARIMGEGSVREAEVRLFAKDGRPHDCLLSVEPIEFGNTPCLISMMIDISDRRRAEQEVRALADDLERRVQQRTTELTEVNRELESFAYSMSHDLRAPLRGIDGFSRLLQEDYEQVLDAKAQDYLTRVRRAAQRMGTLIDDLLELSRVSRLTMHRVKVDLSALAREILATLQEEFPERKVTSSVADGCIADGDPQLLRVLLQNLLENAWKFTQNADAATIAFSCETNASGEAVYAVRDNGAGFDMRYAEKLFSPFQRLHSPAEFEGSGVGLASAARVVRRHGGRIWAEGAPGHGAAFHFTLTPAAQANTAQ